ncbi:MAG: hypothetical protein R3264_09800 [Anaerolineae bacterium]|nr:hypothetical protein [Anaerolineae bacterium]
MTTKILYKECPLCTEAEVAFNEAASLFRCENCGLSLKEQSVLGLFKKGKYSVTALGNDHYPLATESLANARLAPDALKVALGNVYRDDQLADLAAGNLEVLRPVRTILAEIILEQLREACFIHVLQLRRGHGPPLTDTCSYLPTAAVPRQGMDWQDEGNLFGTTNRLVLPSDRFTHIRLDRKLVAVQAFTDGVAIQRKGEEYATYFVDCFPHEAALVAAYVIGKVPALQKKMAASVDIAEQNR